MSDENLPRKATLDDVVNLARRLEEAGVDYLLIGGYALNAHGYTRATEDVDILLAPGRTNGEKVSRHCCACLRRPHWNSTRNGSKRVTPSA